MSQDLENAVRAYYQAVVEKDAEGMAKWIHPDVVFISPLRKLVGKEAMLESANQFANALTALTIRAICSKDNQVMLVYDLACPEPIGAFHSAGLIEFKDGLMIRSELFFDARPFTK